MEATPTYERSGGLVGISSVNMTRKDEGYQMTRASTLIQSAYRGFASRKESLENECEALRQALNARDDVINKLNEELRYSNATVERLTSELDSLRVPAPSMLSLPPTFTRSNSAETATVYQSDSALFSYQFGDELPKEAKEGMLDSMYAAFSTEHTPLTVNVDKLPSGTYSQPNSAHASNIWGPIGTNITNNMVYPLAEDTMSDPNDSFSFDTVKDIWSVPAFQPLAAAGPASNLGMYANPQTPPQVLPEVPYTATTRPEWTGVKTNFKTLVDKIIRSNDQPSSIFLQQKLRVETNVETKAALFDAILQQSNALMKNRFGNFLVQCCFEYSSTVQMQALVGKMRGQVMVLSCDRFGCHVMQKALDTLDQDSKISIISELVKCINECLTHRFACHVWQRIFEIKWEYGTPSIMATVFSSLKTQWHSIANDENGSLVVQCVFENCSDQVKSDIVVELFEHTLEIARGQWGNWVMQHLLEHGTTEEKSHITAVVADNVLLMSLDQYASKVVERCLKVCSKKEVFQIINFIISEVDGAPLLVQMMNHQYGNYVVQNILCISDMQQREQCLRILMPNMHLLRCSKYGQRVASLCDKYLRVPHSKLNSLSVTSRIPSSN